MLYANVGLILRSVNAVNVSFTRAISASFYVAWRTNCLSASFVRLGAPRAHPGWQGTCTSRRFPIIKTSNTVNRLSSVHTHSGEDCFPYHDTTTVTRENPTYHAIVLSLAANRSYLATMDKLDRKIVDETLEELDFLFIENDPNRLKIDKSKRLGEGGYGEVYEADLFVALAQQTIRVAVKMLRSDPSKDLRVAHRLLREICVWSDLRHPNVLCLIGFHLSATLDVALLVCPLEPLGSVDHFLKGRDLDTHSRMQLVAQAVRGVEYLHGLNPPVTHGDIKAANTLINQQGEAMLCDFGLAKSNFRSGLETSDNLTGSMPFFSPELFEGAERGPSSDMWAFGCLVIEIVLGVKPFATVENPYQIVPILQGGGFPASEESLRDPVNLWDGLMHCWHSDPKDRVRASEFSRYWHLKIRKDCALEKIEEPVCPKAACTDRRQQQGILKYTGRSLGIISVLAAISWYLKVFYIIIDRFRYSDQSRGRATRALEALPRATKAAWSAVDARSSCLEGTRTSVLKTVHTWYSNTAPDAPLFFNLDGIAGIGKTTIACTIAKEAARHGYLAGSFFFTRSGETELSNPALVFPTLAYQLATLSPSFTYHFGRAAETAPCAAYGDLRSQLQKLIISPLQHVTPPSKPLLIVLDALDECQKEGAKELLRLLLSEASKIPFPLKVLVTSRPEPHLRTIFNHADDVHQIILHDIEASIVKSDIRLYLQTSFAEISRNLDLPIGKAWARHDEIEVLVERAETLFIVAATFVRFAGDDTVRDPRKQLDLLLQRSESSFTGPNTTIDELYLQILRKIRSTTGSPHIIERLRNMVGALVTLRSPLPIPVMERLLGFSAGDGGRALHHLHSIISIPRSLEECPRIHHASFPDFITDPLRCKEPEFSVHIGSSETRLATRCLQLTISSIETGLKTQETEYGSRYWPSHLSKARFEDSCAIDLAEAFTSRCFMRLFEAVDPSTDAYACFAEVDSQAMLRRSQGLTSQIVAIALDTGDTRMAIKVLQHGHRHSDTCVRQYRKTLDALRIGTPKLASEFLDCSLQFNKHHRLDHNQIVLDIEQQLDLSQRWNALLRQIQVLPEFTTFLKPNSFRPTDATARRRVTIVNVTKLRSDVITLEADAEPIIVRLHGRALHGIDPVSWILPCAASPYLHQSTTLAGHCVELLGDFDRLLTESPVPSDAWGKEQFHLDPDDVSCFYKEPEPSGDGSTSQSYGVDPYFSYYDAPTTYPQHQYFRYSGEDEDGRMRMGEGSGGLGDGFYNDFPNPPMATSVSKWPHRHDGLENAYPLYRYSGDSDEDGDERGMGEKSKGFGDDFYSDFSNLRKRHMATSVSKSPHSYYGPGDARNVYSNFPQYRYSGDSNEDKDERRMAETSKGFGVELHRDFRHLAKWAKGKLANRKVTKPSFPKPDFFKPRESTVRTRCSTSDFERAMETSQSALSEASSLALQAGEAHSIPDLDQLFKEACKAVRNGYSLQKGHKFVEDMDDARMRDNTESLLKTLSSFSLPDPIRPAAAAIPNIALQIFLDSWTFQILYYPDDATRASRRKAYRSLALRINEMVDATLRSMHGFRAVSDSDLINTALEELRQELADLQERIRQGAATSTIDLLMARMRDTTTTIQALVGHVSEAPLRAFEEVDSDPHNDHVSPLNY
ncbi:hypothetical protein FRB94_009711 [Tulasnella sp. JGI-2019a]|nr:hypothetical protein FRB94_009711 [Tulasnella sp. JGI-2019a]